MGVGDFRFGTGATRTLQSPATKSHTAAAPATQRHTATYHSLHQPPRATLQRYQDASITCHQMSHWCCACHATSITCHHMSHWCCACHATSHCNVPFPAPATQSHAPTLPGCFNHLPPNVTLVLRLPRNVNHLPPHVTLVLRLPRNVTLQRTSPCTSHPEPRCSWKCHVYKRSNFTCTSEPISRAQANPRPPKSMSNTPMTSNDQYIAVYTSACKTTNQKLSTLWCVILVYTFTRQNTN